jgi:type I restriction enzyme S subunit
MSKTTNQLIPELRFPEFVNDGEWEECSIESIGDVVTGGTPSKEDVNYWGGDFVWATAQDFKNKYIFNSIQKLTQKGKDKSRVIPKDSVLVTCIASIGLNAINKVECATNQQINSIICKSENHFEFVYYSISHNGNRLKNIAGRTAVPIISKSVFEKFIIHKPQSPKEQQRIASCLSSLDEVIAANSQKLELLKEHKKGLMQNLFPQTSGTGFSRLKDEQDNEKILSIKSSYKSCSDNVPNYRFPEFENDGEWVEKTIGEFATLQRGFDLPVDNIVLGEYPVVFSNGILKFHNEYKVKGPGVVTGRSGTIGKVTYVEKDFWPHNTSLWVTDFCGNFPMFVFYYFVLVGLEQFSAGGGVPTLNRNDVHRHNILIPPTIPEQQKIASYLSSLDALIAAQAEKIEQLKVHKKGLMQGLFPKLITPNSV